MVIDSWLIIILTGGSPVGPGPDGGLGTTLPVAVSPIWSSRMVTPLDLKASSDFGSGGEFCVFSWRKWAGAVSEEDLLSRPVPLSSLVKSNLVVMADVLSLNHQSAGCILTRLEIVLPRMQAMDFPSGEAAKANICFSTKCVIWRGAPPFKFLFHTLDRPFSVGT